MIYLTRGFGTTLAPALVLNLLEHQVREGGLFRGRTEVRALALLHDWLLSRKFYLVQKPPNQQWSSSFSSPTVVLRVFVFCGLLSWATAFDTLVYLLLLFFGKDVDGGDSRRSGVAASQPLSVLVHDSALLAHGRVGHEGLCVLHPLN